MTLGPSSEDLLRPADRHQGRVGLAFPGPGDPFPAAVLRGPAPHPDRPPRGVPPSPEAPGDRPAAGPAAPPAQLPAPAARLPARPGSAPTFAPADRPEAGATASPAAAPRRPPAGADGLDPRLSFEAFVVGSSNRLAHNAALGVAESTVCPYNPLFIHGDSGNGKTHLLHAIGLHVRRQSPGHEVRYVTCERFTSEFIAGIQASPAGGFTSRYRSCSFLLVDDLQFLEGKVETQQEFFHTFNEVTAAGGRVILSADCHPGAIPTLSDRLRSRFASGLVADLGAPEFETRVAILARKAAARGVEVGDDVLAAVAASVTRSVRELEGALTRVMADAALDDRPVTLAGARASLQAYLGSAGHAVTCGRIIDEAASVFGVSVEALRGHSRTRSLVQARQSAMYVCRSLTDESLPAIGRAFGDRDHTTVLHAVRKIEQLMAERATVYAKVVELANRLGGRRGCEEGRPG
ncbi:MAG: chromosomal replication initiator protein DnaA [Acidimicrobiia bacterium]